MWADSARKAPEEAQDLHPVKPELSKPKPLPDKGIRRIERSEIAQKLCRWGYVRLMSEPTKAKKGKKKKSSGKGKTKSTLTFSERKIRAFELFGKGFTVTDVAKDLGVSRNTATSYKKRWKEEVKAEAQADPASVRDVLTNTKLMLDEVNQVRAVAWENLHRKPGILRIECESCEHEMEYQYRFPPGDTAIIGFLNLLTKTADQRAKLLGLMGVDQRLFNEVMAVNHVQQKMLVWLGENLDALTRGRLADFIDTELAEYVGAAENADDTPAVLDRGVIDAIVRDDVPALPAAS